MRAAAQKYVVSLRDGCGQSWTKTTTTRAYLHLIRRQRQEIVPQLLLWSGPFLSLRRWVSCFFAFFQIVKYFAYSSDAGWKGGQISCPASQRSFRGGARAFVRADIQLESRLLEEEPWKRLSVPPTRPVALLSAGVGVRSSWVRGRQRGSLVTWWWEVPCCRAEEEGGSGKPWKWEEWGLCRFQDGTDIGQALEPIWKWRCANIS